MRCYVYGYILTTSPVHQTDPKGADYICEIGATRNFEGWRADNAEMAAADEAARVAEAQNPMAVRRPTARCTEE